MKALHGPDFNDFVECDDYRKKACSPVLCANCLSRRAEFEKTTGKPGPLPDLTKMKARIEIVGDFADLKKVAEMLRGLKAD